MHGERLEGYNESSEVVMIGICWWSVPKWIVIAYWFCCMNPSSKWIKKEDRQIHWDLHWQLLTITLNIQLLAQEPLTCWLAKFRGQVSIKMLSSHVPFLILFSKCSPLPVIGTQALKWIAYKPQSLWSPCVHSSCSNTSFWLFFSSERNICEQFWKIKVSIYIFKPVVCITKWHKGIQMIIHLPKFHLCETAPDKRNPMEKSINISLYIGLVCRMEYVEFLGVFSVNFSFGKLAI